MGGACIGRFLKSVLAGTVALAAALAVATAGVLWFAHHWQREARQPERADAIVVLAGAAERAMYAADLYRQGCGAVVYVVRPVDEPADGSFGRPGRTSPAEEERNRAVLQKRGVPEHAVRIFREAAVNTLDEARIAFAEIPPGAASLVVVTSPNHARRAQVIFSDVFAGRGTKVMVVANPYEPRPADWRSEMALALQAMKELAKIVLYTVGIRYAPAGRTYTGRFEPGAS